ncbi:hypothetical protein ABW20_dc0108489 [Dactylellina cionopaga]|nr:hypothetical protein ABW20_dc0108489 [Dactylellina cionopaga]
MSSDTESIDVSDMQAGTITTSVVRIKVRPENPVDFPKLTKGVDHLADSDHTIVVSMPTGREFTIAGPNELHLRTCIKGLEDDAGIPLVTDDPTVSLRESVGAEMSQAFVMAKSPNKRNRICIRADPIDPKLSKAIEAGIFKGKDARDIIRTLRRDYGWNEGMFWAFSDKGSNILYDNTGGGIQYLDEVKDSIIRGFMLATDEGPLCGEPMRSVRLSVADALLHADSFYRGANQIVETARRAMYGAFLSSEPIFLEPIYSVEIQTPAEEADAIQSLLVSNGGTLVSKTDGSDGLQSLQGSLPVRGSFGFADIPQTSVQLMLSSWEPMPFGNALQSDQGKETIDQIRKSKGMGALQGPESYIDQD